MTVHTIPEVTGLQVLGHWRLRLTFDDGVRGDVELSNLADAGPMYEPLRDAKFFASAYIGELTGTVTWPGDIDLDPESLHAIASEHPAPGAATKRRSDPHATHIRGYVTLNRDEIVTRPGRSPVATALGRAFRSLSGTLHDLLNMVGQRQRTRH
jgi:Protein of unknown function (DUF2442)